MDNYSSLKTCGTCVAFGKSSCAHPATKIDCFACMKYQEISTPIMKEEQTKALDYYEFTNVYKVNDDVIVANTIEEAIELWKKSRLIGYDNDNIKNVELIHYNAKIKRQSR